MEKHEYTMRGDNTILACLLLVAVGTAVRAASLSINAPWWAPDQVAWGLQLEYAAEQGLLTGIVHYPHEGVSVLYGLIAWALARLGISGAEAISWAALWWDTVLRGTLVALVAHALSKRAAVGFSLWTVAACPLLVARAGAGYGFHLAASVFPFALVMLGTRPQRRRNRTLLGLLAGLSLAFHTVNALAWFCTAIVLCVAALRRHISIHQLLDFVAGLLPGLVVAALYLTHAYQVTPLLGWAPWSPRGLEPHLDTGWQLLADAGRVAFDVLPDSLTLFAEPWIAAVVLAWTLLGCALAARWEPGRVAVGATAVLLFVCAYAAVLLPELPTRQGSVILRHFAYIAPVIGALAVFGWSGLVRFGWATAALPTLLGLASLEVDVQPSTTHGAGWVLALKLGMAPERATPLLSRLDPTTRDGWLEGMGRAYTHNVGPVQAIGWLERYPIEYRSPMLRGIAQQAGERWGSLDRAMWYRKPELSGTYLTTAVDGLHLDGNGNARFSIPSPSQLRIVARGTPADNQLPEIEILVDGVAVQTLTLTPTARVYDLGTQQGVVDIRYGNDHMDAFGHDRNVHIPWVEIKPLER